MSLAEYRAADQIAVNPYTFDAGQGPGLDTVNSIIAMARAAGCEIDPGGSGGPIYLKNLPKDDDDLAALLELAQLT